MIKFLKTRISELNNVTWPTRKQAIHSMIAVIIIMVIAGFFLSGIDFGLKELVLRFLNK